MYSRRADHSSVAMCHSYITNNTKKGGQKNLGTLYGLCCNILSLDFKMFFNSEIKFSDILSDCQKHVQNKIWMFRLIRTMSLAGCPHTGCAETRGRVNISIITMGTLKHRCPRRADGGRFRELHATSGNVAQNFPDFHFQENYRPILESPE